MTQFQIDYYNQDDLVDTNDPLTWKLNLPEDGSQVLAIFEYAAPSVALAEEVYMKMSGLNEIAGDAREFRTNRILLVFGGSNFLRKDHPDNYLRQIEVQGWDESTSKTFNGIIKTPREWGCVWFQDNMNLIESSGSEEATYNQELLDLATNPLTATASGPIGAAIAAVRDAVSDALSERITALETNALTVKTYTSADVTGEYTVTENTEMVPGYTFGVLGGLELPLPTDGSELLAFFEWGPDGETDGKEYWLFESNEWGVQDNYLGNRVLLQYVGSSDDGQWSGSSPTWQDRSSGTDPSTLFRNYVVALVDRTESNDMVDAAGNSIPADYILMPIFLPDGWKVMQTSNNNTTVANQWLFTQFNEE